MKKKITKCSNCHEKDCELEEIIIDDKKKNWCDSCIVGYNLENQDTPAYFKNWEMPKD